MRYGTQAYVFLGILILLNHFSIRSAEDCQAMDETFNAYWQHMDVAKKLLQGSQQLDVTFSARKNKNSSDTFKRKGILTKRPGAIGTIVIGHGYTHSKDSSLFLTLLFPHLNVLVFDFRGHGDLVDSDQYSTLGRDEMYDVQGAVAYIRSDVSLKDLPIIGFGFSMGAVALLMAQAEFGNLFDMLVLDSPFDSSDDCLQCSIQRMLTFKILGRSFTLPGSKYITKALYDPRLKPVVKASFQRLTSGISAKKINTLFVPVNPIAQASKIKIPCMFITCEKDASVTVDRVERLYETVQSPFKRLWITHGSKHCDSCWTQPELYAYKINNFIKKVLKHDFSVPEKRRDDRVIIQDVKSIKGELS